MKNYIITKDRTEAARVISACRIERVCVTSRRLTSTEDIIEVDCGIIKFVKLMINLKMIPKMNFIFGLKKL